MTIDRIAKKLSEGASCSATPKECLGCKDCKGPCLLYMQLHDSIAVYGLRRGSTA